MKYRIQTDGEKFRVQIKRNLFFWNTLHEMKQPDNWQPVSFDTISEAKEAALIYIKRKTKRWKVVYKWEGEPNNV